MSKPGTTWIRSKRKMAAIVAGAAILAGTVGVVAPQPDAEIASTWSFESAPTIEVDGELDIQIGNSKPVAAPKIRFSLRSTWS